MKWLELSVNAPTEFAEPLSQIFYRYGHGGVAIEEKGGYNPDEGEEPPENEWVTVKTYLPINSTTQDRLNHIDLGIRLVAHVTPMSDLETKEVEEEEWQNAWKEHFYVLHIGRRVVIQPSWRDYEPEEGEAVVVLDPGMAFGTGHHPTTRMCLEELENAMKPGMDVLDVGCGSGILSIAAAKLGARNVFGLEIDSVAVGVAKQNIRDNNVEPTVRIIEGTLPNNDVPYGTFDLAIANISARVVSQFADDLVNAVKPGGIAIASGILVKNKDEVIEAFGNAGGKLKRTIIDGDWVTLVVSTAQ